MYTINRLSVITLLWLSAAALPAQSFFFGADLSYVNEMEDCGVVYKEAQSPKDPYAIFADYGCKLVRLRLWHTPSWYDTLNQGRRYADIQDLRRSIRRAREKGMQVLLDFHLSDTWADPGRQLVPVAWLPVVDDLPLLKDSLYNYVRGTLLSLHAEGLLPEMVQIGNETNRGILLSPQVNNAGWSLDWARNSQLFNRAIEAVRDVGELTGTSIRIGLHAAGPDASWLFNQFIQNGVTDFDIMGISYYWAWHKPTTIAQTGQLIANLRSAHPGYEVMIFETGYLWTWASADGANNIINEANPAYLPVSPENQRRWLVDLTQEVINRGGSGVIYWEPAWVSSPCYTPWGQGSHQEHATFFDFSHNLLENGGIGFMAHPYENLTPVRENTEPPAARIWLDNSQRRLYLEIFRTDQDPAQLQVFNSKGEMVISQPLPAADLSAPGLDFPVPDLPTGVYFAVVYARTGKVLVREKLLLQSP